MIDRGASSLENYTRATNPAGALVPLRKLNGSLWILTRNAQKREKRTQSRCVVCNNNNKKLKEKFDSFFFFVPRVFFVPRSSEL